MFGFRVGIVGALALSAGLMGASAAFAQVAVSVPEADISAVAGACGGGGSCDAAVAAAVADMVSASPGLTTDEALVALITALQQQRVAGATVAAASMAASRQASAAVSRQLTEVASAAQNASQTTEVGASAA